MKTLATLAIFSVLLLKYSHQRSNPQSNSYVAAVVEFSPFEPTSKESPPDDLNADSYASFIREAGKQEVDIIVFPEAALTSIKVPGREHLNSWTTLVPEPSANYIPCIDSTIAVRKALRTISCAARENAIYVVVNLEEKVICDDDGCPSDKKLFYNTNVVFNREGKIIARYRKTHLYNERGFNVTAQPELVTFNTDFGVTFGTFTCFDILFKKPAVYLTRMLNVTDIVFPTAWFSQLPFLTALQMQFGWSYAEDANLLVAGYDRPSGGNSGSGIYLGRQGIAEAIIPFAKTSKMLVANVPKKNRTSTSNNPHPRYEYSLDKEGPPISEHHVHDELRRRKLRKIEEQKPQEGNSTLNPLPTQKNNGNVPFSLIENEFETENSKNGHLFLRYENLTSYKSIIVNSSLSERLCDGDFCCYFKLNMDGWYSKSLHFRLLTFNGIRAITKKERAGVRACAIVRCLDETINSCGKLQNSITSPIFYSLSINATFPNYADFLIIPTSASSDLRPISSWGYEERYSEGSEKTIEIAANLENQLRSSPLDILACGIYARDFSKDTFGPTRVRKGSRHIFKWVMLAKLAIVSIFLIIFLYRKAYRIWQRNHDHNSAIHDPQLPSKSGQYETVLP